MVLLTYTIFENNREINIDCINDDENVIKNSDDSIEYKVTQTAQDRFTNLLTLYKKWNKFVKTNNIFYWATAGTFLGAIRHKGFIPWDNDIDISVFLSDLAKIKQLLSKQTEIQYIDCEIGLRLYFDNINDAFIDVFVYDYDNNNTIKLAGFFVDEKPTWYMHDLFPKEYFVKDDIYPLLEVPFEDTTIMIPNNNTYLFRTYLDDCLTSCVISSHVILHEFISFNNNTHKYLKYIYYLDVILNKKRDENICSNIIKVISFANESKPFHAILNSDIFKKIFK